MIYLKHFNIATSKDENALFQNSTKILAKYHQSVYPFNMFPQKQFDSINFNHITIFAGANGSGKSTLLNIIAYYLGIHHNVDYNTSPYMSQYKSYCKADLDVSYDETKGKIITSDDVFGDMFRERKLNIITHHKQEQSFDEAYLMKCGERVRHIDLSNQESIDHFMEVHDCKKRGGLQRHVLQKVGKDTLLYSNGENAIDYFVNRIESDGLYLLDEPENSLSPEKQLLLKSFLEEMTRFENCQFIIATHSPFLLALNYSTVYDLDDVPVITKHWSELAHVRQYFDFFNQHRNEFL